MRLLKALALIAAVGAWAVIVIGGYVSQTGSGLGCSELVTCGPPTYATAPGTAVIEGAHRLAAWVEGFSTLGLLVLVWWRYRSWTRVRNLTTLGFLLLVAQAGLGILAVATTLSAAVVTTHLGVATAFLAVMVWNAATVWRGNPPQPRAAPSPAPPVPHSG